MGLFDFLSGSDEAEAAAAKTNALLAGYGTNTNSIYDTYQDSSLGAIGTAYEKALADLAEGKTGSLGALNTGLSKASEAGQSGVDAYSKLSDLGASYQPAIDTYLGSLGLSGAEGKKAAEEAYTASPGYQYQVDQAIKQLAAKGAQFGNLGGGNTASAVSEKVRQMALGEYGGWQNKLAGFVDPQLKAVTGAASGTAGAYKTLADIYSKGYGGLSSAYEDYAKANAGVEGAYGENAANVYGNVAGAKAQSAKDVVTGNIAANNQVAQAGQTDAANLWGLIGAGAKAAGSAYGGGGKK
jgi:hypothetical protein